MNRWFVSMAAAALVAPIAPRPLAAQGPHPVASPAEGVPALSSLRWREIGPANMSGRVTDIDGIPGDPRTYYVSAADGGIWKTTNQGTTFEPIFEDQAVYSVGALTIAPSDPNVLWVGTGEGDPRNSRSFGNGVYRSTDAGASWTHVGLDDTESIKRIAVHPRDPSTAYVCALGHAWGANEERGVFKTSDGGRSWQRVLYKDADTGCSEIMMDPSDPDVLYAGLYKHRRKAWIFEGGGGETGLYKSTDAGASWTRLTNGLPRGPVDRVGVAISATNPNIVYTIMESRDEGILFRSDDAGASWRLVNDDQNLTFRPFYYSDLRVDPQDPDRVYAIAGSLYASEDGGRTFRNIGRGVHGDHQALWIDPQDPRRILDGSDGGWQVSYDRGETWTIGNTVAFSQFYQIFFDDQQPYNVCGGLQDNGNWCGPSNSLSGDGILKDHWFTISGGDGFYTVPVPGSPHLIYSTSHGGNVHITDLRRNVTRDIVPYPKDFGSFGGPIMNARYRYNWDSPVFISPHDPNTVYFGGNVLFRTTNGGQSWTEVSPDLTTNDKSKQQSSGGPVTNDNTAAEFYSTILTIAESPVQRGVIWVGTDDGNIQVTQDGGATWTNTVGNIRGLPANSYIARIDASHHQAGTAYVAVDRHRDDDFTPHAFVTTDYGRTWTDISDGLPDLGYVQVIREDPRNPDLLYVGTELGIFGSWDRGRTWRSLRNNLPPVSVRDIKIHPRENDLIIGTHGRGAWILDDITPLQQLPSAMQSNAYLFETRPAIRWQIFGTDAAFGSRHYAGEDPEYGAIVSYALRSPSPVTFTVADGSGKVIREWTERETVAGVNRTAWDLRHQAPAPAVADEGDDGGLRGRRFSASGPRVAPGRYTLTMRAAGQELTTPVTVEADPRQNVPQQEYLTQEEILLQLRDLITRTNAVLDRTESLASQLGVLHSTGAPASVAGTVETALGEVREFRTTLTRMGRISYREAPQLRDDLSSIARRIDSVPGRPTDGELERFEELKAEVRAAEEGLRRIVDTHVTAINSDVSDAQRILVSDGQ